MRNKVLDVVIFLGTVGVIVCIILAIASVSCANYDGYVSPAGYTYNGGLWYYGGVAYTRTLVSSPGYWSSCGTYYPGSSYYSYTQVALPAVAVPKVYHQDWKLEHAAIIKSREDHLAYLRSLEALGYPAPAVGVAPRLGLQMPYELHGNAYQRLDYGQTASTQFGYSTLAQLYGQNDTATLFQMANQQVQGSQRLLGDATASFFDALKLEGTNRARVAEILVKGQQATQILQALQGSPASETRGASFRWTPATGSLQRETAPMPRVRDDEQPTKLEQVIGNRCAACHSGKVTKGGLDLADWPTFTEARKQQVWERITSSDPKRMMPRDAADESRPGQPLTAEEKRAFALN